MDNKIRKRERISYGLGGIGAAAYQLVVISFMTYFYTDVFGISAAAVATLMLVSRVWDGINDPIMGALVDRTRTRWGRFRAYMLFVPPFLAISFVLLFTTPNLGQSGNLIYAYITYMIYVVLYTMYDIASNSLAPAMSNNREEKKALIATFRLITGLAGFAAVFGLPAVSKFGQGNEAKGFQYYAILVAIISIIVSWIAFFNTKERVKIIDNEKIAASEYISLLKKSKPFIVFLLFIIVGGTASNLQGGLNIHYMKHYIARPDLTPIIMFIGLIIYLISASTAVAIKRPCNIFAKTYGYRKVL